MENNGSFTQSLLYLILIMLVISVIASIIFKLAKRFFGTGAFIVHAVIAILAYYFLYGSMNMPWLVLVRDEFFIEENQWAMFIYLIISLPLVDMIFMLLTDPPDDDGKIHGMSLFGLILNYFLGLVSISVITSQATNLVGFGLSLFISGIFIPIGIKVIKSYIKKEKEELNKWYNVTYGIAISSVFILIVSIINFSTVISNINESEMNQLITTIVTCSTIFCLGTIFVVKSDKKNTVIPPKFDKSLVKMCRMNPNSPACEEFNRYYGKNLN
jgi:hypothetical protein